MDSDFATPGNWLVRSGGSWVATATAPANNYGYDDIFFEGAPTANMPVLSSDYTIRRVFFLSGGWTLDTGNFILEVSHGYGGGRKLDNGATLYDEFGLVDSSGSGITNVVRGTVMTIPGLKIQVDAGSFLLIDGVLTTQRGGYSGAQQQFGFSGNGTLILGGDATNFVNGDGSFQRFNMSGGILHLAKTAGAAISAPNVSSGTIILDANEQITTMYGKSVTAPWILNGTASVDVNHVTQSFRTIAFGAKNGDKATGVPWSGAIHNTDNLTMGNGVACEIIVHPTVSAPVVFDGGVKDSCGRWSGSTQFLVSDLPDEPVELVFNGPFANGRTGGNDGHAVYFKGNTTHFDATGEDETSHGAIAFHANTTAKSQYFAIYVQTTVFANGDAATGTAIPVGGTFRVDAPHGVLRGHGKVAMSTENKQSDRTLDVYGTLAPGSIEQPAGTLTFDRSATNYKMTTVMHTNSVFRVETAPGGALPAVVQASGLFQIDGPIAATEDPESGETVPGVPGCTLLVTGAVPPAEGVHRLLTTPANGLSGTFDEVVLDFPGSRGYQCFVEYGTNTVDFRCSRLGSLFLIQ